ncbi:MAG: hypothetical protein JKY27_02870 [Magnetovibrio sp.]|nr:hypothetical protein [Magnetovibrio sp.]
MPHTIMSLYVTTVLVWGKDMHYVARDHVWMAVQGLLGNVLVLAKPKHFQRRANSSYNTETGDHLKVIARSTCRRKSALN